MTPVRKGGERANLAIDSRIHPNGICNSDSNGSRGAGRALREPGGQPAAAGAALLSAASCSSRELDVGTRLLGLGTGRILLGSRDLGARAGRRCLLDARLLGFRRLGMDLESRILGT